MLSMSTVVSGRPVAVLDVRRGALKDQRVAGPGRELEFTRLVARECRVDGRQGKLRGVRRSLTGWIQRNDERLLAVGLGGAAPRGGEPAAVGARGGSRERETHAAGVLDEALLEAAVRGRPIAEVAQAGIQGDSRGPRESNTADLRQTGIRVLVVTGAGRRNRRRGVPSTARLLRQTHHADKRGAVGAWRPPRRLTP